jgi:hypothetical protein
MLLQSLAVRAVLDDDGAETGMIEVPAGEWHYSALELLMKEKRLARTAPIPCVVRTEGLSVYAPVEGRIRIQTYRHGILSVSRLAIRVRIQRRVVATVPLESNNPASLPPRSHMFRDFTLMGARTERARTPSDFATTVAIAKDGASPSGTGLSASLKPRLTPGLHPSGFHP